MKNLNTYLDDINHANTTDDAFVSLCQFANDNGYEHVCYTLLTDHKRLGLPKTFGFKTTYPDAWVKHYKDNDYIAHDPVVLKADTAYQPFFWDDLKRDATLSDFSLNILTEGEDAGLRDGIAVPLRGHDAELAGIGFARQKTTKEKDVNFMAEATLLATAFYEKFISLNSDS